MIFCLIFFLSSSAEDDLWKTTWLLISLPCTSLILVLPQYNFCFHSSKLLTLPQSLLQFHTCCSICCDQVNYRAGAGQLKNLKDFHLVIEELGFWVPPAFALGEFRFTPNWPRHKSFPKLSSISKLLVLPMH